MKHLLVLLGAVGLMMPLTSSAAPTGGTTSPGRRNWIVHTEVIGRGPDRQIYYYTNLVVVGSHLPVVLRRYHGQLEVVSGIAPNALAYASSDINGVGTPSSGDVATALSKLDPAIIRR